MHIYKKKKTFACDKRNVTCSLLQHTHLKELPFQRTEKNAGNQTANQKFVFCIIFSEDNELLFNSTWKLKVSAIALDRPLISLFLSSSSH